MQRFWPIAVLCASISLQTGCAPTVAQKGSNNGFAFGQWKMPKMPWSKDKHPLVKDPAELISRHQLGHKPEPSAYEKFSTAVKDSTLVKGVDSAWHKTTAKFASLTNPKDKLAPPDDPIALDGKQPEPSVKMHNSMARLLESSGQNAKAEQQYRMALEIEATNAEALLGLGHLLDRQRRFPEATELYQRACQHHPQEAACFNDLGLCLARQQRLDESVSTLNQAVQLQPQRKLYRNNLAAILIEMQRNEEAFGHLAAVHGPAVAHFNLAHLLHQKGNQPGAIFHFQQAAQADPNLVAARRWVEHLAAHQPVLPPSHAARLPGGNPLR